ncbi:MAG: hypothetical protein HMLKMBBP_01534 [Planctomycetes bacterium]|nr:hypothetical protein [Planctomycetota bacterium]
MNPNNCDTCDLKSHADGGWCHMWRHEPNNICMYHTGRRGFMKAVRAMLSENRPQPSSREKEE